MPRNTFWHNRIHSGLLLQQTENHDAVGRADINFSVSDHRRNEFVARKLIAVIRGLIAVVQLGRKVGGIVRVKHSCAAILHGPYPTRTGRGSLE